MSRPEFLSKIGTHLLASSDSIEENSNSLVCLRNAGSHFAISYCITYIYIHTHTLEHYMLTREPCVAKTGSVLIAVTLLGSSAAAKVVTACIPCP